MANITASLHLIAPDLIFFICVCVCVSAISKISWNSWAERVSLREHFSTHSQSVTSQQMGFNLLNLAWLHKRRTKAIWMFECWAFCGTQHGSSIRNISHMHENGRSVFFFYVWSTNYGKFSKRAKPLLPLLLLLFVHLTQAACDGQEWKLLIRGTKSRRSIHSFLSMHDICECVCVCVW